MSNTLYEKARERFLSAQFNWTSDTFNLVLVTNTIYTPNTTTHEFYSSPQSGVIAGPVALAGKTIVSGAADANDVTFTTVNGATINYIICYKSVTTPSDSPLLFIIDTATGLPITPNGGDIIVTWDNGANKIFKP